MTIIRVYPVADLVMTAAGAVDFQSLIELITSTVRPQSWDSVGGPGSIKGYEASTALFSAKRCGEVHEEVEELLTILRKSLVVQHVAQLELNVLEQAPRDAQDADADVERYRPTVRLRSAGALERLGRFRARRTASRSRCRRRPARRISAEVLVAGVSAAARRSRMRFARFSLLCLCGGGGG